uniref:NADH-ubiquinone oxidoreductase chain 4L n=1 Tax=Aposthonia japonica TaxID=911381 RepID=H7CD27_9NEOP|nr:NADH dehydrogenase subunit 4L [Aposthonia japonica]
MCVFKLFKLLLVLMFYMYMFVSGLVVYIFKCNYLLVTLLGLEYISLSLFVGLVYSSLLINLSMDFLIIFLIMMVCEGVLGLSLLVMMVRSSGVDLYSVLSIMRC